MAKKITAVVKLQLPAGKATPGPPVGSSLGPHGINIPAFTKEFNEKTSKQAGLIIPVVITIYQGVKGVDTTLIKAARVLGAKQTDIFFKITIPASTPFILVAARLGLSTSLTTLMASEIVGGDKGIGMMIQRASGYYQMDVVLMGIILLGIIGIIFEKIVKFLERRFTGWQETIQQ